ncbi:hypothetical protein [Sodalis glossinidius]|uniref:hypothetical protein n=1 Tax=Sodalis glossinidius TaxID=63612 RepID=UPI00031E8508|nr:hypothetical protein [Sodalis glossinidius]
MEALHARRHGIVGRLAINAPFGFGRRYVVSVVAAFRQRYPDVDIRMTLSVNLWSPAAIGAIWLFILANCTRRV